MSEWQRAFEANKHAVGRAVHEAWAAEKVRQGFADHVFAGENENWPCDVPKCTLPDYRHHTDMLDYADLKPHIQEYDIQTGIVGFRMGYEAALAEAQARIERLVFELHLFHMAEAERVGVRYTDSSGCKRCCAILAETAEAR